MKNSVFFNKICYYWLRGDIMKRKKIIGCLIIMLLFTFVSVEAKGLNILDSTTSCTGYFGSPNDKDSLMNLMVNIFDMIKIAVPIILVVATSFDFSKVVFSDAKDAMEKAKKNFFRRAIIAVVIFFVPIFLEIILSYVNNEAISACLNNFK